MRGTSTHIATRLLAVAVAALAAWPCAAAAWGPPRSGGFGPNVMRGGDGADFLRGAEGHDRVYGRGGADLLTGDTGPDFVSGGGGNDTLSGGSGNDGLDGGDGNDIASGGFGADVLQGGPGGDALDGNQDKDVITGGPGDDLIHGGSGIDRISGGPGDDRIFADSGGDFIDGGDGDDVIVVDGSAFAHIACGAGRDTVYLTLPPTATADYAGPGTAGSRGKDCEVVQLTDAVQDPNRGLTYLAEDSGGTKEGSALDDVLLGGPGADTLRGRDGNDVLWGLRQAGLTSTLPDVIDAGPGDDTVYGGPGPQQISGGAGDDFLEGGLGANVIKAGTGDDTIRLRGGGSSVVRAGAGRDTIFARGPARGTISCGAGRDIAHVDAGDSVTRDCEKVVGKARRAAAASRSSAVSRAVAAPTYADLVSATPGLKHWWRMSPTEQATSPYGSYIFSGIVDRITGAPGSSFQPTALGPTDDGDTAFETSDAPYANNELHMGVPDTVLHGDAFTFEGWFRPGDSGVARALLNDQSYGGDPVTGVVLVREADGSLRATIGAVYDARRVELRSPPLDLGTRWHHIALTRTPDRITLYVDGAVVADGAATPVTADYTNDTWYVSRGFNGYANWLGGIDEVAVYDRALDAATVNAHARVGDDGRPPVTRTNPVFGPLQAPSTYANFVTDKGGSSFRCGLDGAPLAPCPNRYLMENLADGQHVLRVEATDRFGLTEVTPTVLPFTVDSRLPHTIAFVWLPADGDRQPSVVIGSEKPGTFECFPPGVAPIPAGATVSEPGLPGGFGGFAFWTPCASGSKVIRDVSLGVRAVDVAGNRDPLGLSIPIPRAGQGFQGPESGIPTFAGARVEVAIGFAFGALTPFTVFECRIDGAAWKRCPLAFRLPILHAGRHTMQVRRLIAGTSTYLTTREFVANVAPSKLDTLIVGLQANLVIERGKALARRPPLVRFALNRPADVQVEVLRGGKQVLKVLAKATTGPNVIALPTRPLQRLPTGRYALVVTARGTSGPLAVQRLPLALVSPLR